MTFPGVEGIKGPGWLSTTGFQVRQSRAGQYPGTQGATSVVAAMGTHAPAWAVTAAALTVAEEVQDEPHPIEEDDFELPTAYGGTQQFGVDQSAPSDFENNADPGYTGR